MKVYLNEITGIADAMVAMYMSKRTWTRQLEDDIRDTCSYCLLWGKAVERCDNFEHCDIGCQDHYTKYDGMLDKLLKWGTKHITLLRYIDFSITVEGLHRGGMDDLDSHAMRFNNRIIRSSTRLATFGDEMSEWYEGKIIPTDMALGLLGHNLPERIQKDGRTYIRTTNGYIEEALKDNKDAKRGLYMLSIPSNFIFKVNLTEWAHVYKERNKDSAANPEVKRCVEMIADRIEEFQPKFNRKLFMAIKN